MMISTQSVFLAVLVVVAATNCVLATVPGTSCRYELDNGRFFDLTGLKGGSYKVLNATNLPSLDVRGFCSQIEFNLVGCPSSAEKICDMRVQPTKKPITASNSVIQTYNNDQLQLSFERSTENGCTKLTIQFQCDRQARFGNPTYVGVKEDLTGKMCTTHMLLWPSMFACLRSRDNQSNVDLLIDLALSESLVYPRLDEMTRLYGHRLSGSLALEKSIDWVLAKMAMEDNIDVVYTEPVQVPTWVRGNEYARILAPREINMNILGLGLSNGTGPNGIRSQVIVVESFEELEQRADEVPGKIVLHNAPYVSYGANSNFRRLGAITAQKYGAVASLVRSITPFSLSTPHTGSMETASIPGAAITIEDADLIASFVRNGQPVEVFLYMEAHFEPDSISRNIIAELRGTTYPNEVVVMGGHIDSWDVGTGVLDDAGGAFVSWDALRLMAKYNIRPKRTVRAVFWTNEENGANGARVYKENRESELSRVSWAIESDSGTFSPIGVGFTGSQAAFQIMTGIGATYLARINAGTVTGGGGGVDIEPMCDTGVPCSGLNVATSGRPDKLDSYFFYHHTFGDTMTAVRENELSLCTASMAAWTYAVADLDTLLPRN